MAIASAIDEQGVRVPGFTEAQYQVAEFLLDPRQNDIVFEMATGASYIGFESVPEWLRSLC